LALSCCTIPSRSACRFRIGQRALDRRHIASGKKSASGNQLSNSLCSASCRRTSGQTIHTRDFTDRATIAARNGRAASTTCSNTTAAPVRSSPSFAAIGAELAMRSSASQFINARILSRKAEDCASDAGRFQCSMFSRLQVLPECLNKTLTIFPRTRTDGRRLVGDGLAFRESRNQLTQTE
jgi:hypothetical protein